MLVLSRKADEAIFIGDNIRLLIVELGPTSVRIGIEAPDGVRIMREELLVRTRGQGDGVPIENAGGNGLARQGEPVDDPSGGAGDHRGSRRRSGRRGQAKPTGRD